MLWRKIWRDLKQNKVAYIACIMVISIGLMVFTSISMVIDNLQTAKDNFYRSYHFADGFAKVRGMPYPEIARLAEIEGIANIRGRLVKDVKVFFPQKEDNVYLRLVSYDQEKVNAINGVKLVEGMPLDDRERNIWLSPEFLSANKLNIGDQLPVIIEGRKVTLTVSGTGRSPEFVTVLRNSQELLPSPENFGIAYIPYTVMKTLFREKGLVNDIVFTVKSGYSYKDVEAKLKPRLDKYGLESMIPRKDQISNVMISQELVGLKSTSQSMPILFLLVASTILYILLKRMVEQQRGQIGTLKAFGYSNKQIVFHYLSYAILIGFLGGAVGGILGIWLSFPLTGMYQQFFSFPDLRSQFSVNYLLFGIFLSLGFSIFAGYHGSKSVLKLQPAEAMRPPAPSSVNKTYVERVKWFWENMTIQGKMGTRNIFRNKSRSFFTFLGIMFAYILMAMSWYFQEITDILINQQFTRVQTYDVKISYSTPIPLEDMEREFKNFPSMKRVEPMLEVPATLINQWLKKDVAIIGLNKDTQLYNILDRSGNRVPIPADGVLLSNRLAELLNAEVGTKIIMKSPWTKESSHQLEVVGINPQYLGLNAYMNQAALNRLLGQGELVTAAMMLLDDEAAQRLKNRFRDAKGIASIEEKNRLVEKYTELIESYSYTIWIMAVFAVITGFAIVYNSSIISLSERKRELASLRVLGMTPKEVLQVITFEQWFISLFAMLAGVPLTIATIKGMAQTMNNDVYSIPVILEPYSYIFGFAGTIFAIWLAQLTLSRRIHKLSLVEVLKERD